MPFSSGSTRTTGAGAIDRFYREALADQDGFELTAGPPEGERSSHCLSTGVLDPAVDREGFRKVLAAHGVQTTVHYPLLHRTGAHAQADVELPVSEAYAERCVTLPLFPQMRTGRASWSSSRSARPSRRWRAALPRPDPLEQTYAEYSRSPRKQRSWAADNPGNLEIRAELLGAILELGAERLAAAATSSTSAAAPAGCSGS